MSATIRSMTGFARLRKTTEHGEISVSLKSVNHRGLDLHFHLPSDLDAHEAAIRASIKRAVLRGHVDVRCAVARADDNGPGGLNVELFHAYLQAFRKAAAEGGLDAQPDLNRVLQYPGMLGAREERESDTSIEGALIAVVEEALESLNQFRAREGAELVRFLREQIRSEAVPVFQKRLLDRLRELLGNSTVDPQRLAQEAAILADRSDIGEEIERLKIHARQLEETLDTGGEVGKKIDFLLQEMNRESNTILSKTNGIGPLGLRITDLALAAKAAIDKIREQALNLE
jgi:uncharacterized protein (TIGR00255 family)